MKKGYYWYESDKWNFNKTIPAGRNQVFGYSPADLWQTLTINKGTPNEKCMKSDLPIFHNFTKTYSPTSTLGYKWDDSECSLTEESIVMILLQT